MCFPAVSVADGELRARVTLEVAVDDQNQSASPYILTPANTYPPMYQLSLRMQRIERSWMKLGDQEISHPLEEIKIESTLGFMTAL